MVRDIKDMYPKSTHIVNDLSNPDLLTMSVLFDLKLEMR